MLQHHSKTEKDLIEQGYKLEFTYTNIQANQSKYTIPVQATKDGKTISATDFSKLIIKIKFQNLK